MHRKYHVAPALAVRLVPLLGCMISLILSLPGCNPPTQASLVGKYDKVYPGWGTDTIELRADGTFLQSFKSMSGGVKSASGTWRIEDDGTLDLEGAREILNRNDPPGVWHIPIVSVRGNIERITFDEDG